jgi:uncharacterized protein YcbK (DUF882 family)
MSAATCYSRHMDSAACTRRSFVAAALATASTLLLAPRDRAAAALPGVVPGRLALYNIHTREAATVAYRNAVGLYDGKALDRVNHVLRCHYTGEVAPIDVRVIEFLRALDQSLGGDREIHVISGFRSAAYNAWLVRHGSGVSSHSLHLVGRAIDVRFPGVALADVRRVALALGQGGVGYYPDSDFVHLDSGRVRSW